MANVELLEDNYFSNTINISMHHSQKFEGSPYGTL